MTRLLVAGNLQLDLDGFLDELAGSADHVQFAALSEAAQLASQADVVLLEAREHPRQALWVLRALRQQVGTVDTPVLVLADPIGAIEALGAGATAISRAPSDPATVAAEVKRLAGKSAQGGSRLRRRIEQPWCAVYQG